MPKDVVLIVDDEAIILRMCSIAVAAAGFRAVVAENGAAGLETFMQLKDEICLVLSDIIMPAVSGIDMAETIRRRYTRSRSKTGYRHLTSTSSLVPAPPNGKASLSPWVSAAVQQLQ